MSTRLLLITVLLLTLVAAVPASANRSAEPVSAPVVTQSAPPAAFVTVNMDAGIPLDPFFISLQGGGSVDASTLDTACNGWVPTAPSVTFNYKAAKAVDRFKFFIYSDGDPVLVVKTPDGKYVCNDNTNPLLLDPTLTVDKPQAGTYSVWAGNHDAKQLVAGMLVITTKPDVNLGTFQPGLLVKRPSIPETLPALGLNPANREKLRQAIAALTANAPKLQPGGPDVTSPFVANGNLSPVTYTNGNLQCDGQIKLAPTYVFTLTGTTKDLRIFAEGNHDSNLIVKTPAGPLAFVCDDDAAPGNYNPLVDIPNPPAGFYAVWVGNIDAAQPVTGTLTVTQSPAAQPETLKVR
jgi:hypothetical protein